MADHRPLLAACIVGALAHPAGADERRLCSYAADGGRPLSTVSFLVSKDILTEEFFEARYHILENNEHAFAAQFHFADYDPVLLRPYIYLMSVMIDKTAKQLTYATVVASEKATCQFGQCHRRDTIAAAGNLTVGSNANK
jgi:hypothetical protein